MIPSPRRPSLRTLPFARLALCVALAATAGACGDAPGGSAGDGRGGSPSAESPRELPKPGTGVPGGTPDPAASGEPKTADRPRAATPLDVGLPDAPPLTRERAKEILVACAAAPRGDVATARLALRAMAAVGDVDGVRAAAAKLLAKGPSTGGYEDPEAAAAALAALVGLGDRPAADATIALAEAAIEADDYPEPLTDALGALPPSHAAKGRELLGKFALDPFASTAALDTIARLGDATFAPLLHGVAGTEDHSDTDRGLALAGLLALGDPRAEAVREALLVAARGTANASEIIDGLGTESLAASVPAIRRFVADALEDDLGGSTEIRAAALALVSIRGPGKGDDADRAWLRSLLGKDDGFADTSVRAALWTLGEDAEAEAAATVVRDALHGLRLNVYDVDDAVAVLEGVAARGLGGRPPFDRVVDAAAAAVYPADAKRPDVSAQADRLRTAAAWARLAAK